MRSYDHRHAPQKRGLRHTHGQWLALHFRAPAVGIDAACRNPAANPKIHASMSSLVGPLFQELFTAMGAQHDYSVLINEEQRRNVLRALFEGYYRDVFGQKVVFDTNRCWCSKMDAIAQLFPQARVIACVRDLAWIMDSFERLYRKNALLMSGMFKPAETMTVYSRVDALAGPSGPVRFAWNAIREAFYGQHTDRLIIIEYEELARDPKQTIDLIYDRCGLPHFKHDFDNVSYEDGREFINSGCRAFTAFPARFDIPTGRAFYRPICLSASRTDASGAMLIRPNARQWLFLPAPATADAGGHGARQARRSRRAANRCVAALR
jgi:sulfotransferase